jgi:hypothetical protein
MNDLDLARIRAHRNNIHRYRWLLATHLADHERAYIERRLSEERACIETLSQQTFPCSLPAALGAAETGREVLNV